MLCCNHQKNVSILCQKHGLLCASSLKKQMKKHCCNCQTQLWHVATWGQFMLTRKKLSQSMFGTTFKYLSQNVLVLKFPLIFNTAFFFFFAISAVSLHGLLRLIPILNQLREGLRLYGVDEVLGRHGQMCQQTFVPGFIQEVCYII